jgi:hypothetical protein
MHQNACSEIGWYARHKLGLEQRKQYLYIPQQRSKQLSNVPSNYSMDNERQNHNAEDGGSSLKKPDNLEQSVNEHNFNLNSQSSKEI